MELQSVPSKILASNVADTSNSPRVVAEENLPREYAKKVIISGHVNLFVFWHNNCIRISKL